MARRAIYGVAVLALGLGIVGLAVAFSDDDPVAELEPYALDDPGPDAVSLALGDAPGQQEAGLATIQPLNDSRVRIGIRVQDPSGLPQAAHLYSGGCAGGHGEEFVALPPVGDDGHSVGVVDLALERLRTERWAVDVHESTEEDSISVLCGVVPDR